LLHFFENLSAACSGSFQMADRNCIFFVIGKPRKVRAVQKQGNVGIMHLRIIAVMAYLAACSTLAWGQSATDGAASASLQAQAPFDERDSPSSWRIFDNRFWRRAEQPVAENAELAEELRDSKADRNRIWFNVEFMLWQIKGANIPPLVTTGALSDPLPGALSSASTTILFGGSGLDYQDRSGGRFTMGLWFDEEMRWGLNGSYFFLAGRSIAYSVSSPGNPVLAVPFFNVNTGAADSSIIAYPGVTSGHISVDAPSFLQSAEANLTAVLWYEPHVHLQGLIGFRYAGLNEGLRIEQSSLVNLAPQYIGLVPLNGNTIAIDDYFGTRNQFYGAQIGGSAEFLYKRLSLEISVKAALGASNEVVGIHGSTTIDTQPATTANAGLLALSSNSGQYSRNVLAVVPELSVNLGFQLTDHIRMIAGYSFLYWSSVARPGDQIDTAINPNLVPTSNSYGNTGGLARPAFVFHSTDFFAHGVNLGLEVRY
jgi:hypothetical protein